MNKSYTELCKLQTFEERYDYLKLNGQVGHSTFGHERYLNQKFYQSKEWQEVRRFVIIRDNGLDLGIRDVGSTRLVVHHINPITIDDFQNNPSKLLDPENLISVTRETHDAIHYGTLGTTGMAPVIERTPYDTSPWKIQEETIYV